MKKIIIMGLFLTMEFLYISCGGTGNSMGQALMESIISTKTQDMKSRGVKQDVIIPQEIEKIPDGFLKYQSSPEY